MKSSRASGKFVLRIPRSLHQELQLASARERISLNELCSRLLSAGNRAPSARDPLIDAIRDVYGEKVLGIIAFGSRARGEAREGSDWDLLIVLSDEIPLRSNLYRLWEKELEPRLSKDVSPHFVHLAKDPEAAGSLWFEVAIDGIILYEMQPTSAADPEKSVTQCLQKLRRIMAEGRIQRKLSYGHPYWVRRGEAGKKGA